jgi:hypothetical protein
MATAEEREARFRSHEADEADYETCSQCDQLDWAQRWFRIISKYNAADSNYKINTNGLSEIVERGINSHDAR